MKINSKDIMSVLLATVLVTAFVRFNQAHAITDKEDTSKFECCFHVVGVKPDDELNIRAAPGRLDTLLEKIPFDGTGIRLS